MDIQEYLSTQGYTEKDFNFEQLSEIKKGLDNGLDVSIYGKPIYNSEQMYQIRSCLDYSGIDLTEYVDETYNAEQMYQIKDGLYEGLDIRLYADKKYD